MLTQLCNSAPSSNAAASTTDVPAMSMPYGTSPRRTRLQRAVHSARRGVIGALVAALGALAHRAVFTTHAGEVVARSLPRRSSCLAPSR